LLFYRSSLPLSRPTLEYLTGVLRRHRKQISSKGRALTVGQQALMTLAYLKKAETFAQLGAAFNVGTATAWRYVNEAVKLLSARSPKLTKALRKAKTDGLGYVVLDGTLIPIDRVAADGPFYSGKHKKHGMNLQLIAAPDGTIVWVSGPLPGSVHDLRAARIWAIVRALTDAGLLVLADKGYLGAGQHIKTPYRGRNKPESQKSANRSHAKLRAPGERANAQLKTWKILTNSAAAPTEPVTSPRPSTSYTTARPAPTEKRSQRSSPTEQEESSRRERSRRPGSLLPGP
jgi:hypothetical protein